LEKHELVGAIERRAKTKNGLDVAYYPDDDSVCYLAVDSEKRGNDATTVLNYLPEVVQDHLKLTEAVQMLLGVVAQQQLQIQVLQRRLEAVVQGTIAVKLQNDLHAVLKELAEKGCDVTSLKTHVTMSASSRSLTETQTHQTTESRWWQDSAAGVQAEIGGIIEAISKFNVHASHHTAQKERVKQTLLQAKMQSVETNVQGEIKIEGSITGAPLPKEQAKALAQQTLAGKGRS
jgi:hypothetical protein